MLTARKSQSEHNDDGGGDAYEKRQGCVASAEHGQ